MHLQRGHHLLVTLYRMTSQRPRSMSSSTRWYVSAISPSRMARGACMLVGRPVFGDGHASVRLPLSALLSGDGLLVGLLFVRLVLVVLGRQSGVVGLGVLQFIRFVLQFLGKLLVLLVWLFPLALGVRRRRFGLVG